MLFLEIWKIRIGHIEIMLFKDITKIELTGSHFENMLILEICQIRILRRPC